MGKGIIVVNMTKCCAECDIVCDDTAGLFCVVADRYLDGEDSTEIKPDWCPIKPMPVPKAIAKSEETVAYSNGWNSCIDTISNGADVTDTNVGHTEEITGMKAGAR